MGGTQIGIGVSLRARRYISACLLRGLLAKGINLDNYENNKWYIRFNRKSIDMTAIYDKSQVVIAYHSATIVYGNVEKHREHMLSKLGLILRDLRSFNTYLKDKA